MADLISDHCAVHCRTAMRKPPFRRELKTYRKMKAINLTSFSTDIENSDLYTSQERLLEESVTQYNDVLGDLLEKHAPLKTKLLTIRPAAHWVNDDILSATKGGAAMEVVQVDRRPGNLHEPKETLLIRCSTLPSPSSMPTKLRTRLATQKPISGQWVLCCKQHACQHCLKNTWDNC